ncbi:hypothetical protein BH10PSE9_BH10PSE9_10970 [soil metagenome]
MFNTVFDVDVIAAGEGETLNFADGDTILHRGAAGDRAFVVKRGMVEIRQKSRALETIAPGEIFGELSLLDGAPRVAVAVAVGPVEVVAIDRPLFTALLRDDPEFALAIVHRLARRLRATTAMFERCVEEPARAELRLARPASA